MKLRKYLEMNEIVHRAFADKLGISRSLFSRYLNGSRVIPLKIAVKIEKLTKGKVLCKNLN